MNSFTDFRLKSWEMMKSYHSFHSLRAVNTWSHSWTICCRRKTDMNLIKSWLGDFSWILGKKSVMDHHTVLRRHIQTLRRGGCSLITWGHHYIPEDRLLFLHGCPWKHIKVPLNSVHKLVSKYEKIKSELDFVSYAEMQLQLKKSLMQN